MQKYGKSLLPIALPLLLSACGPGVRTTESNDPEEGIELMIHDNGSRVLVYVVNNSEEDIAINDILRISGESYEIGFVFDGIPADLEMAPAGGLPEIVEGQDTVLILRQGALHGSAVEKSAVRSLYGIEEGECMDTQATFKERVEDGAGRFAGELVSSQVRICY